MAQCSACLLCRKLLVCFPLHKKSMVVHICNHNPSTWEAEAELSKLQRYLQLHSKIWTSLGYMKFYQKKKGVGIGLNIG